MTATKKEILNNNFGFQLRLFHQKKYCNYIISNISKKNKMTTIANLDSKAEEKV
jgi:hypothetical protein